MDFQKRVIDLDSVDMESFEGGYKEAYKEVLNSAQRQKVEILFNENGEWTGHAWESNCVYSLSDMERNKDYCLGDDQFYAIQNTLIAWENDVID